MKENHHHMVGAGVDISFECQHNQVTQDIARRVTRKNFLKNGGRGIVSCLPAPGLPG